MSENSIQQPELGGGTIPADQQVASRFYLAREPFILTALAIFAVAFFLCVSVLSHVFHAQEGALGTRWFERGMADLEAKKLPAAVSDFRAALQYEPANYSYQLRLAEALMAQGRSSEARAYLLNLWEREADNGRVNLELARIAVQNSNHQDALRYYHNAIYSTWIDSPSAAREQERRNTRMELVQYLLKTHAYTQAQSELIALAANLGNANLPDASSQYLHVGRLFIQAGDNEHALAAFRESLKLGPPQPAAWAGAGLAAFNMQHYDDAEGYLRSAVAASHDDTQSASLLKTTQLVIAMDPFGQRLPMGRRNRTVIADFNQAGERLQNCSTRGTSNAAASAQGSLSALAGRFDELQSQITDRGLRRDPDLIQPAMDLAFDIERQTSISCGPPTGPDLALLLIAKLHEGR